MTLEIVPLLNLLMNWSKAFDRLNVKINCFRFVLSFFKIIIYDTTYVSRYPNWAQKNFITLGVSEFRYEKITLSL